MENDILVRNEEWGVSERLRVDFNCKLQEGNGKFRNCVGDYKFSRRQLIIVG